MNFKDLSFNLCYETGGDQMAAFHVGRSFVSVYADATMEHFTIKITNNYTREVIQEYCDGREEFCDWLHWIDRPIPITDHKIIPHQGKITSI